MRYQTSRSVRAATFGLMLASLAAGCGGAQAQSMNANAASYNAGYGRFPDRENQPVSQTMRDANGDLVAVDGFIDGGSDLSTFSNGGAGDTVAGAGARGADTTFSGDTAGVTVTNHATLNVSARPTNSGNSSADSALNGDVDNAQ
jgi:holdfast attachment protein HfaA